MIVKLWQMRSFKKKLKTLLKTGIDPLKVGVYNFNNFDYKTEALAIERKNTCVECPLYVDEPIPFLRVTDERIKALSNKMCDDCGCTLSYKLRQSIVVCEKWQN